MKIQSTLKRALIALTVLVQITFFPAATFADETIDGADPAASSSQTAESTPPPAEETENQQSNSATTQQTTPTPPPPPSQPTATGPSSPTGADGGTYTYNDATGLWENDLYTWNPKTGQTSPKTQQDYSYNPETGMWDTTEWSYDAPSGKYVPNVVSSPSAPGISGASPLSLAPGDPVITNTGPGSSSTISVGSNSNGFFNNFYNARITNNITSGSHSGNAGVVQNTVGGNSLSGSAEAFANLLNMLQSSWNPANGSLDTFQADVNGNVYGDLYLDPSMLISNNGGNASETRTNNLNLQVNDQASGRIDNNVVLDASSGNSEVANNNQAGDASSGDAKAVANIVNLMNSSINAGHSFIGVLNINGNLDGDILLPPWLLQSLIAATGPGSNSTISQNRNQSLNANLTDNQAINNNVNASASSGSASVANNTQGGTATTGSANTNVTILNLTGKKVVSKDALLVFVNVFGRWVGLIMNAPAGSSSAALGINNNSGNASISDTSNQNTTINSNSDELINNNVTVGARSGNASVHDNTVGGNATSGDAEAGVNIANIIGSELDLSGWFGVLFINVFGTWNGSFGVNTAAGGGMGGGAGSQSAGAAAAPGTATTPASNPVFAFIPHGTNNLQFSGTTTDQSSGGPTAQSTGTVSEAAASVQKTPDTTTPSIATTHRPTLLAPAIGFAFTALLLGGERLLAMIQSRRKLV